MSSVREMGVEMARVLIRKLFGSEELEVVRSPNNGVTVSELSPVVF